jgi:hypothetical protein
MNFTFRGQFTLRVQGQHTLAPHPRIAQKHGKGQELSTSEFFSRFIHCRLIHFVAGKRSLGYLMVCASAEGGLSVLMAPG